MYDTLHHDYYWPHMAKNVNELVDNCLECGKMRENYRQQRNLKLFPAKGPLQFVAMDILGPLLKTERGVNSFSS